MSKWNNNEWADLCSGKACSICLDGKPHGIVAELATSYLTSTEASPMKGYCCLILKRHVVELYELATEEAAALMRDIQQKIAQYGASTQGIPPIFVYRGTDNGLIIFDGVTRATRVAKLKPGTLVRVEVIGELSVPCAHLPTIGDQLP